MKSPLSPPLLTLGFLSSASVLLGQIEVSVQSTTTSEDSGQAQIELLLSAPAPQGASLTATVVSISADEQDYTPTTAQITFPAGSLSSVFTVPLTDDNLAEAPENFQVFLSNPSQITIPDSNSDHTILSDDAGLTLPDFFSDGMVLQRTTGSAIWGYSLPGSNVTVTFAGQTRQATADDNGRFQVTLTNLAASSTGRPLVISTPGVPTRTINDVLVGEVWLAAGQSNMDFPLSFLPSPENNNEINNANDPLLRIFIPTERAFPIAQPLIDGDWLSATPGDTAGFSALAYYFGQRLRTELGVPVAFLECAWGGQPIEGFISEERLETFTEGQGALQTRDFFYGLFEDGEFSADPRFLPNLAGQLYNGMVAPMVGYGVRGILWYQGEFNALSFNSDDYTPLLTNLAEDLRARWDADLPFYYVQLPNFEDESRSRWVNVQNAQRRALERIPNSGMTVNNDIGDIADIHPINKSDFAERLVRWPLSQIHGQTNIIPSGPVFRNASRNGSVITVFFDYDQGLTTRDGGSLGGFEVRTPGGAWVPANASIEGRTVQVSALNVAAPVGVRYAWAQNPATANLVNSANLPTSIFDAIPSTGVTELFRDSFNDTNISLNPDSGGGLLNRGTTDDVWRESQGQITYFGAGGNTNRANAYTANSYSIDDGFTLEVDYQIESLATTGNNQFSFGLLRDYTPSNNNGFNSTSANQHGIGFAIASGFNNNPEGLVCVQAEASTSSFTTESPFLTEAGSHRLSLTVIPDGNGGADWNYSYDGGVPVSGNIPVFDFTSDDYNFVTHARGGSIAKSIQRVRLTTFGEGLPVLSVSADPTNEGLIGLFVTFSLSQPSTTEVSVQFDTVDGVALAGQDYLPFVDRVVSFAPGQTEHIELLTMVDDAVIEPDETFSLALSDAIGLAVTNASVPLVIINDDTVLDDFGDSHGLSTPERAILSDGDNDGNPLFIEFAFNLDPTVAASPTYVPGVTLPFNGEPTGLPALTPVTNPVTGETEVFYRYIRRTDSTPKVTYFTQISSDGINFVDTQPDQVRSIDTFWQEVTVMIGGSNSTSGRCFARVRIEVEDDDGDGF